MLAAWVEHFRHWRSIEIVFHSIGGGGGPVILRGRRGEGHEEQEHRGAEAA